MANIRLRTKGGTSPHIVSLDRVPIAGDYVADPGGQLFRVMAVVFTPENASSAADVFAIRDPDGVPNELKWD